MDNFLSAEQLDIPEDYRTALIKAYEEMTAGRVVHTDVYEYVNFGATPESPADNKIGWNMAVWDCDTACCIGGLAEKLSPEVRFDSAIDSDITTAYPDLYELFYPNSTNDDADIDYESITIPQGIQALHNYLTTGKANWHSIPGIPLE